MRLEVRLFAVARQLAGAECVVVELPERSTVAQLRAVIARQVPALAPHLPQMLFAIGNEYAHDQTVIAPQVEVACIPPVSGG